MRNLTGYKLGVVIDANGAKALSTLAAVDRAATKTSGSLGSLGSVAGGVATAVGTLAGGLLTSAITSTVGAVGGFLKDAAAQGIAFNATVESASISLKRLMGNAAAATGHIEELKIAATQAPVGFTNLLKLDQLLQNVKFSAAGLPALLRDASRGVALMAGTDDLDGRMERITVQLAQMTTKGKAQAEELNILAENLIPVYDLLANATGLSVKKLQEYASKGQLKGKETATLILQELAKASKEVGAEIDNSYAVLISNLQDKQEQLAGRGTQRLFAATKEAAAGLLNQSDAADKLADKLDAATGAAVDFGKGILTSIRTGNFATAGMQMVEGVASGIKSGATTLWDQGKAVANQVWSGIKKEAGINSPAENFKPLGLAMAEGIAVGITNGESIVNEALGRLIGGALMAGGRALRPGESRARTPEENRQRAEAFVDDPRVRAFLDTISKAEGAGYKTQFGGGQFGSYNWHPQEAITRRMGGKRITSTAAGRYQFLSRTWNSVASFLGLDDFSPRNQDIAAVELLRRRGVLGNILGGDISGALTGSNKEWASLPGSPYGQPTKRASDLIGFYNQRLAGMGGTPANTGTRAAVEVRATKAAPLPVMIVDNRAMNAGTITAGAGLVPLSDVTPSMFGGLTGGLVNLPAAAPSLFKPAAASTAPGKLTEYKTQSQAEARGSVLGGSQPGGLFAGMGADIGASGTGALAGLKDGFKEVKDMGKAALSGMASGVGNIVQDFVMLGETGPAALKKVTAQVLASASAEAATLAIMETAKGFATMFTNPAESAGHFAAAGLFAAVAVGTGLAGRGLAGKSDKGGISEEQRRQAANANMASESYAGNQFTRRAMGGPVNRGRAYIVGENRAEVFVPNQNGQIVPSLDEYGRQQRHLNELRGAADKWEGSILGRMIEKAISKLEAQMSRFEAVRGQDVFLQFTRDNPRAIGRAAVSALDQDDALSSRLGRRIAA